MWTRRNVLFALGAAAIPLRATARTGVHDFTIGASRVSVYLQNPQRFAVGPDAIYAWAAKQAGAVAAWYGVFPVPALTVRIDPTHGTSAGHGVAYRGPDPLVHLQLGTKVTAAGLEQDWVLTHEMIHHAFPDTVVDHTWFDEGQATYIEPWARAAIGQVTPETAWKSLIDGAPEGQPAAGDKGLDHTPTWGRTYWGGALFCLECDVEIRKRTDNQKGLQHALRAIVAAGGHGNADRAWSLEEALKVADQGVGVPVLSQAYARHKATAVPVDLDGIWKQLGIAVQGDTVVFDDAAPLAAVRRAICGKPT